MSEGGEKRVQNVPYREYRPDSRFSDGLFAGVSHLLAEVWQYRAHIAVIFGRDFRASYHGTVLGVFWNIALPLLPITVYALLSVLKVFPAVEDMPRGLFVAFNATIWFLLAGMVEQPIQVVRSRNAEAMKTSLPLSVSISSSFARLMFETLVRLVFVAGVAALTMTAPTVTAPLAIVVILVGVLFAFSLGLVLAIANIVLPDIQRIVTVVLRYGIFLSGVIFPLSNLGPLAFLDIFNPFAIFIHAARDVAFYGFIAYPVPLAVTSLITVVLFLFAARLFYLMEHRIRGVL